MTGAGTALSARGVSKAWRGRPVLRDVDLDLAPGRLTAVLGPSGAGKSTLLRALAGLETIDAGQITSGTRLLSDARAMVPPEKRGIGIVFQDGALFPHLTALENVAFGLKGKQRRSRASDMLAALGLTSRARAYPHQLSGGEQQRVALARALAPAPGVILLDEPFSSLDEGLRRSVREGAASALREAGTAALLVTHDPNEAMSMADDLVLLIAGRVVQRGSPETVYARPVSAAAARLLGDVNEWHGQARQGKLSTPFGKIASEAVFDGPAIALVRPEGLRVSPGKDSAITVAARHPLGGVCELVLAASCGTRWRARVPSFTAPPVGASVKVAIEPHYASLIAGSGTGAVARPGVAS